LTPANLKSSHQKFPVIEHGIPIAHNGARYAVKLHNIVEEEVRRQFCCVRMTEWQEVAVLGEPINDTENHRFSIHTLRTFDKLHVHVRRDGRGHLHWLQKNRGLEMLHLVAPVGDAGADEVSDSSACPGNEEIGAESMKVFSVPS
jgi:hypothetical protein